MRLTIVQIVNVDVRSFKRSRLTEIGPPEAVRPTHAPRQPEAGVTLAFGVTVGVRSMMLGVGLTGVT